MTNNIKITNKIKPFKKKINVSSDKSISIRCILLASQAIGQTKIYNLLESEDVMNTLNAVKKLGIKYKSYSWGQNYGYGTKQHLRAIKKFGVTIHHRKTFSPVNKLNTLK